MVSDEEKQYWEAKTIRERRQMNLDEEKAHLFRRVSEAFEKSLQPTEERPKGTRSPNLGDWDHVIAIPFGKNDNLTGSRITKILDKVGYNWVELVDVSSTCVGSYDGIF